MTELRIGPRAIKLMHHFEGCKLTAYRCPAGVWTIGWGDTGPHVKAGLVWTQEQADAAFKARIEREFAPGVAKATREATAARFGAMVALAYNIGVQAFSGSSVARLHKAGSFDGAAASFGAWNKARVNGVLRPVAGLTRRRAAEAALYRSDFAELSRLTGGDVT